MLCSNFHVCYLVNNTSRNKLLSDHFLCLSVPCVNRSFAKQSTASVNQFWWFLSEISGEWKRRLSFASLSSSYLDIVAHDPVTLSLVITLIMTTNENDCHLLTLLLTYCETLQHLI